MQFKHFYFVNRYFCHKIRKCQVILLVKLNMGGIASGIMARKITSLESFWQLIFCSILAKMNSEVGDAGQLACARQ